MSVLETLAFEKLGQTIVVVHAPVWPSDEDWASLLKAFASDEVRRILAVPGVSPGPTPVQRARFVQAMRDRAFDVRAVVMTGNAFHRGAITALHWLGWKGIASCRPDDWTAAFRSLAIPSDESQALREVCAALAHDLQIRAAG